MNYDSNPVKLNFDNETIKERVLQLVEGRESTHGITFFNLCYQLRQMAISENLLDKPETTTYTNDELTPEDQIRVSRVLWELIWDKKIYVLFGRSALLGLSNGEDRFVKY